MRPSIRLAALMGIRAIHVFTHDSVHLGEDGPTHQPVEHLDALRAIPNLHVVRPADARETVDAWRYALLRKEGPTVLVLTRQTLPVLERDSSRRFGSGAGIVREASAPPRVLLVASGSEVPLCVEAHAKLSTEGFASRVVSIPCLEAFAEAPASERAELFPREVPRLFVEAGTGFSWGPWTREGDGFHGIHRFGASAPGQEVARELGLSVEAVCRRARALAGA
jgi:transketolase